MIICREDVLNVKPAPDAIEKLKNHYHPSDLIYIGDHDHDVKIAKNAKVKWYKIARDDNGILHKTEYNQRSTQATGT